MGLVLASLGGKGLITWILGNMKFISRIEQDISLLRYPV